MSDVGLQSPGRGWGTRARFVLFGLVAVLSVAVGFLAFDANQAKVYVQHFGYYTISLTFAWALIALYRIRGVLRATAAGINRRERWEAAGVILGCVLLALATAPTAYRVLYDEVVLQATAWQMHFFREVDAVLRGYRVDGVFAMFDSFLDKRPFFFAYLVSLLHDLTGYREENAFLLNHALLPLLLAQLYVLARKVAAHATALAAMFAFGSMSLVAHNATGAGMELLNLNMLLFCVHLAANYLQQPDGPRLSALVLACVLLAQSRYESSLYVGSTVLVVLEGWRRAGRVILPPAAIVGPALLIPYAVHNTYLSEMPVLWELREQFETRFSTDYLPANLGHAATYFFNVRGLMSNSWWLAAAGGAALIHACVIAWRRRRAWREAPPHAVVIVVFGVAICANLVLLMCYYWGQLDDPIVGRLSLPFQALLAFCLALAVQSLARPQWHLARWVGLGAIATCLTHGLGSNARHNEMNTLNDELVWEREVVRARGPGEKLIITNKSSVPWLIRHTSAILNFQARERVDAIAFHMRHRTFSEVLVMQTYRPSTAGGEFQMLASDRMPDAFVLESVAERRIGARLARISRVVEINTPDAAAPARK